MTLRSLTSGSPPIFGLAMKPLGLSMKKSTAASATISSLAALYKSLRSWGVVAERA